MKVNAKRILSTKKLTHFQKSLFENTQIELLEIDFIQTQPKEFQTQQIYEYVIFTSQNAVTGVLNHLQIETIKQKPVLCVGIKTKQLLENNGFNVIECVRGAKRIIEAIESKYKSNSFTFFCGQNRLDVLPDYFNNNQMIWNMYKVYQTQLTPQKIENELDGILFFSPSGVESFCSKNKINNHQVAFCIGTTTAETASQKGFKKVETPLEPSIESVIEKAIFYFDLKMR